MIWAVLLMFAGFGIGWLLKGRVKLPTGTITMISICLLLFALGLEIGSNRELLANLPTMGLTAFIVAVFGILGSCLVAKYVMRLFEKKRRSE